LGTQAMTISADTVIAANRQPFFILLRCGISDV